MRDDELLVEFGYPLSRIVNDPVRQLLDVVTLVSFRVETVVVRLAYENESRKYS